MNNILAETCTWLVVETDDQQFSDRNDINKIEHLDFTCRFGSNAQNWEKETGQNKSRPISVKLSRYNLRKKNFSKKP